MGEGGLAEGGEEGAGEKGWEEHVPPDGGEVIIFGPFLESDDPTDLIPGTARSMRDCVLPSGSEVCPSNVVDE